MGHHRFSRVSNISPAPIVSIARLDLSAIITSVPSEKQPVSVPGLLPPAPESPAPPPTSPVVTPVVLPGKPFVYKFSASLIASSSVLPSTVNSYLDPLALTIVTSHSSVETGWRCLAVMLLMLIIVGMILYL